ncbi:MAG: thioredoxin family protein [Deltaproteobacteria bacterium]|nr:thioredoxin family protein [Deltaproteobacteria bacterium]
MKRVEQSNELEAAVKGRNVAVLFHATWCPFCRSFRSIFEDTMVKASHEAAEAVIDDEDNPLWTQHRIGIVPTVLFFEDGKVVSRVDGRPGMGLQKGDLDAAMQRQGG